MFLNLLLNAAQSIPEGEADRHRIFVSARRMEGVIEISVTDDGRSIARADLPRVFEPFSTLRPSGSDQCLCLPLCHGIVTSHGGTIRVDSAPEQGTTITVRLPALVES